MNKLSALKGLKKVLESTSNLPLLGSNLVFGEGNPDSCIIFIGEAPGKTEDELGRPFVGRSGKLLDQLLTEIGLIRSDIYITNIVKRRPPENRDPSTEEIEAYSPFLRKEIEIIQPRVIATLGRYPMNHFLPDEKISFAHGKKFQQGSSIIFPLYHPAAALRSTKIREVMRKDFRKLKNVLQKNKQ